LVSRATAAVCAGLIVAVAAGTAAPQTSAGDGEGWEFSVTPHVWTVSMKGTADLGDLDVPLDVDLSDISDALDLGAFVHLEARHGQWGGLLDVGYMSASLRDEPLDIVDPFSSMADVETSVVVLDALGSYRVALTDSDVFDFLVGVRWTRAEVDVVVTEGPPDYGGTADDSWIDPLVGIRFSSRFSESWYSWVRMDIGGFGIGSDFTWGTSLGLGYEFNDTVAANLGYKHIGIDWDDGSEMYKGLTLVEHGLLLGVTFSF
jgi:opacity protein-like surface antigen